MHTKVNFCLVILKETCFSMDKIRVFVDGDKFNGSIILTIAVNRFRHKTETIAQCVFNYRQL